MKKLAWIVVTVLGALILLSLAAPSLFRGRIEALVRKEAGQMLDARVEFDRMGINLLRHFPNATLEIRRLSIVGHAPFEGDTLLSVRRIAVVVNLASLLSDRGIEVRRILLDEPAVQALRAADGAVNWDIMVRDGEAPAEPEAAAESDSTASFRLRMRDVAIRHARLRYSDDSTRTQAVVGSLDLTLSGDLSASRSELALRLDADRVDYRAEGVRMVRDARIGFDARIDADLTAKRYAFLKNKLEVNGLSLILDGWVALAPDPQTDLETDLRIEAPRLGLREVLSLVPAFYTRDFEKLTASGELGFEAWVKGRMAGDELPAFGLEASVHEGRFRYASLPEGVEKIGIELAVDHPQGPLDGAVVELRQLAFQLAGNPFRATFTARALGSDPQLSATAEGRIDLGAIARVYPLPDTVRLEGVATLNAALQGRLSSLKKGRYTDISAKGTLALEEMVVHAGKGPALNVRRMEASATSSALTLRELSATLGRSDLEARGSLQGYLPYLFGSGTLKGRLELRSDRIDLNELLGDGEATESEPAAGSKDAAGGEAMAGSEADTASLRTPQVPRNLDLELQVRIGDILFRKMALHDFAGDLTLRDGALRLTRLGMELFGGKAEASGAYRSDDGGAALNLQLGIETASFEQTFHQLDFVQRLVPLFAKTGGNYSARLELQTRLDEALSPVYSTLEASGELRSEEIKLQNLEVFDQLARALGDERLRNIEARDVKVPFTIRDGRVTTAPFDLRLGKTTIALSGSTGLDQTIDYTARVALPTGTAGGAISSIPVRIGGTFAHPTVTLGAKEMATEALKQATEKAVEKLTGGKTLDEALDKQAEKLREQAHRAGEKLVEAARKQGDALVEKANSTLGKAAAKKSAELLVKKAKEQAAKLEAEAERQIEAIRAKRDN